MTGTQLDHQRDSQVRLTLDDDISKRTEVTDPWALPELAQTGTPWKAMTASERWQRVGVNMLKLMTLLGLLYLFICSLDFLSQSFRLLGGRTASQVFAKDEMLSNPVVGLMMGCLVTVLVQSSSTSTSIIVSMVASGLLEVHTCIPMIMGANIGTSVTNTLVSLTQVSDRNEFRRAFGGATIHDMFNWLNVLLLLPLEVLTQAINPAGQGYLEYTTDAILNSINLGTSKGANMKLLKVITTPFTSLIIKTDKNVLSEWALNNTEYYNASLVQHFCKYGPEVIDLGNNESETVQRPLERCASLFSQTELADLYVGLILLAISLTMLCGCLVMMVKILHTLLQGSIASVIRATLNADIPYLGWLTGYLAMMVGCGMTIVVQSSSVFTSALTPLVGCGVISLERMYPLTLGSNIGTTTTALLAALAASGSTLRPSIQIALVHLVFNLTGIVVFYSLPALRWPVPLARQLGNVTATYRWFAVAYLLGMFLILPTLVFGLSMVGPRALYAVCAVAMTTAAFVAMVTLLQRRAPAFLPVPLRSWAFLPEPLRSLQPYDRLVGAMASHCCCSAVAMETEVEGDSVAREKKAAQAEYRGRDNQTLHADQMA